MGLWIFIMAVNLGFSAWAEKLSYYSPSPEFQVERAAKSVVLKTATHTLKVEIRPCNQIVVDHFWKSAIEEFERHPLIKGIPRQGEYAKLDGKIRLIEPYIGSERIRFIPRDFLTLVALDKKQCSP